MSLDDTPLTFGKYKGKTPDEVSEVDPSYIVWMWENVKTPGNTRYCTRALRLSCEADERESELEGIYLGILHDNYGDKF